MIEKIKNPRLASGDFLLKFYLRALRAGFRAFFAALRAGLRALRAAGRFAALRAFFLAGIIFKLCFNITM